MCIESLCSSSLLNSASIVFAFLFILKGDHVNSYINELIVWESFVGKSGFAASFLALATYLPLYPVMLIAPLILIDYQVFNHI